MGHLLLHAQAWWDAQRFDQPVWQVAAWCDQKVRHIQLHVAKALGKVVAAYDEGAGATSSTNALARVRDDVLPDVAIYRSQLLNLFPEVSAPPSLAHRKTGVGTSEVEPLLQVVLSLSRASAQLAAYLEPREHGAASPVSLIREAIADLHASAEALAAVFAVDLAHAHQARLEALLGAPLPPGVLGRPAPLTTPRTGARLPRRNGGCPGGGPMSVVLQVSDTHFGTEQPCVVEALLRLVHAQHPTLVVLSGDITQRARWSQFQAARAFTERLAVPATLVLPGNHDIPLFNLGARLLAPYANYQRAFGPELEPEFASADLLVVGVNTTRPSRYKDGEVSARQITRVSGRLRQAPAAQLRMVVIHQPVHVTRAEDETNVLHGHRAAVYAWAGAGVDLILGGHIHLPYVRPLRERFNDLPRPVWAVQAGTAVSSRVRNGIPNSVNLIRYTGAEHPRRCVIERWDYEAPTQRFRLVDQIEIGLHRDGSESGRTGY